MGLELSRRIAEGLSWAGLPWPAIDEDQLRAWASSVRRFADEFTDSSARTQQAAAELADSSESSVTDALAAIWDDRNSLIADLHGPMYDFADALDLAADAVMVQKGIVIAQALQLAIEFTEDQIAAVETFGLSEALLLGEIEVSKTLVKQALNDIEQALVQRLASVAVNVISEHVNGLIGNLLRDSLAVIGEVTTLKLSYTAMHGIAQQVRAHALMTKETAETAYLENVNRDLADTGDGAPSGHWAAVVDGVMIALRDVAIDLFQRLPGVVVDRQEALAEALDKAATSIEQADQEAGADVPAERDGVAAVLGGTALAGAGTMLLGSGTEVTGAVGGEADLARAGAVPGAAEPAQARISAADPVDVVTGDVLLGQADVTLPGVLPLVLERTHRSAMRTGRWFGPSWASTFDQRLLVGAGEVIGAFADGRVLTWPRPADDVAEPVLPVAGDAWPLRPGPGGGYSVTDPQRGLTWRFEPLAGYRRDQDGSAELPLAALADRTGHEIAFHYDAVGQPISVSHSGGYRVRVTTSGGRVAGLTLIGRDGGPDLPLVGFAYDAAGNLAGVTNSSGRPLTFGYDGARRLTRWTDRNGQSYRYDYDERGRCVRGAGGALSGTFGYEPGLTRWTDAAGAVTGYSLTPDAQVSAVTDPLGNVTRWEHDARGRVTTRVDPFGNITRYAYDVAGNLSAVTRPDGSQAAAEYAAGLLVALTGPDGATWRQEHDERGNRTALVAPDGTVTRFAYDADGHLARVTDPAGAVTQVATDAAGLPLAVVSPAGDRTRYERDTLGRVTAVTGPDGTVTRLEWTPEGHLTARVLPDGTEERWTYDGEGNLVACLDAAGAATSYEYGPFDRLTAVTGPDGTRTEFGYDHGLRLTSVIHGGLAWCYEYDQAGRLTGETDYNAATTRYSYDAAGRLAGRVNAAGPRVDFRYDLLGNLTERDADGVVTTFGYDAGDRMVAAHSPDADLCFEFDALGRVVAETCNGATVRTEYDPAGRVARRVTPSGAATGWEYDLDGRPAAMLAGAHEIRFGYDQAGREIRRELPGGLTYSQEWDQRGHLAVQALTVNSGPPAEGPAAGRPAMQRRAYRYRPDGLVAGIDDLLAGSHTIDLDLAGRVTAITGHDWAERYAYDQVGNLAAASWPASPPGQVRAAGTAAWLGDDTQGRREVSGSLVTRAGNLRYRHDRQGRVTRRQRIRISRKPDTCQYEWDADNRLRSVTTPDGNAWFYRYDPLGRRIAKEQVAKDGTVTARTDFAWDGPVLAEQTSTAAAQTASDTVTWNYLPGTFTPVTQAEQASQKETDQRFYAIITDLVGTPAELAASDGTLAGRRRQTLWGGTIWEPGGAQTPLRFPGQYEDEETGLHYNNQRYYDPVSGAYLTPDPLGLAPAPNPHAYVPNPQVLTDPLGLMACTGSGQPGAPMWSETKTLTPVENALRHFRDHGSDFPDAQNAVQYVTKAQGFLNNPPDSSLIRFRANGDKVVFTPETDVYGVLRSDGAPRTFFIPDPVKNGGQTPLEYFLDH